MEFSEENKKSEELRGLLKSLACLQIELKDKKKRADIYKRLEHLYYISEKCRYRHLYSDIFSTLCEIKNDPKLGGIDILGQNLRELRKGYQSENKDETGNLIDISDSLRKLYDHVSLDIARITYSDAGDWRVSGQKAIGKITNKTKEIDDKIIEMDNKIVTTENTMQEISKETKRMQRDYIAILGIFAAILVAFFSGVGFSSSVLANMHNVSSYRLILGVVLIGIFLFNLMGMLVNFVRSMVDKSHTNRWYIVIGNIAFIVILIILYNAWTHSLFGQGSL